MTESYILCLEIKITDSNHHAPCQARQIDPFQALHTPGSRTCSHIHLRSIQHRGYVLPFFFFFSASDFFLLVGPSSSHTVGPMRAAKIFITDLKDLSLLEKARNTFA